MSTNNELIILKEKEFEVHENSCVDNNFVPGEDTLLKKFKTLLGAIKFVNKYCEEYLVEYGYHIDDSCLN